MRLAVSVQDKHVVYTQWHFLLPRSLLILQTVYPVTFVLILGNLHVSPAQHHANCERVTPGVEAPTKGVTRSRTSLLVRILQILYDPRLSPTCMWPTCSD